LPRLAITAVVLALIGGTTAAFTLTEALKLERSPIGNVRVRPFFSPTCECLKSVARIAFRLREEDRLDAVIVDSDGERVRTLASGEEHSPGRIVYRWDGRTDAGVVAPDGAYRLRVHLDEERRTIVVPNVVRLDTEPPVAELVSLAPRIISPDGDGRRDEATLTVRLSESARPVVLVDGSPAAGEPLAEAGTSELRWAGTTHRRALREGAYVVGVRALDRAGNRSEVSSGLTVRIRYVALGRDAYRTRREGVLRFRVSTDAEAFRWQIIRRGVVVLRGEGAPPVVAVSLPPRVERGRFVLRVVAEGHSDEAELLVGRP
jgi:hypothetical protein